MVEKAFFADRRQAQRLERIVWILAQVMAGDSLPLRRAAERLEVSERTVRRDAQLLGESLFGRLPVRVESNRIYLERQSSADWPLVPATRILQLMADVLIRGNSDSFGRLLALLRPHVHPRDEPVLEQVFTGLFLPGKPVSALDFNVLRRCLQAIQEARAVRMRYARAGVVTERVVEPWDVVFGKQAFYLLGFCRLRQLPREFRLDRIQELEITAESIKIPDDHGRNRWESAFGTEIGESPFDLEVRFAREVAYRVQSRVWHASQEFEPLPDGGIVFRARVSSRIEVVRWVLGYGPYAELLQPPDLRAKIREQLRMASALYQKDEPDKEASR